MPDVKVPINFLHILGIWVKLYVCFCKYVHELSGIGKTFKVKVVANIGLMKNTKRRKENQKKKRNFEKPSVAQLIFKCLKLCTHNVVQCM